MTTYAVKFERIGRNHNGLEQVFKARDADHLAEQIHSYARSYLASPWFDVTLGLNDDAGRGVIEAGRFGTFTIAVTEAVSE